MQKLITIVRIITVVSYFLPFTFFCVTCNKGFGLAYSKKEWEQDEAAAKDSASGSASIADSTVGHDSATMVPLQDSIKLTRTDTTKPSATDASSKIADTHKSENIFQTLGLLAVVPAENSESGIGVFFLYKDSLGKIVVSVSILLSLAILVTGFFKKHNKRLVLTMMCANLLCIVSFIVDALIQQVDLLFGAWLCVCLIISGLVLQYRAIKKGCNPNCRTLPSCQ